MVIFLHTIGPGVLLRILLPAGTFTLTGYLAASLILEAEYWVRQLLGMPETGLIYSQTVAGAAVATAFIGFAAAGFVGRARKMAWKTIRPYGRDAEGLRPPSRRMALFSAACGALVSLLFAALLDPMAQPLWPISPENPVANMLDEGRIQRLATLPMPLALAAWGLKKSFYTGRR